MTTNVFDEHYTILDKEFGWTGLSVNLLALEVTSG